MRMRLRFPCSLLSELLFIDVRVTHSIEECFRRSLRAAPAFAVCPLKLLMGCDDGVMHKEGVHQENSGHSKDKPPNAPTPSNCCKDLAFKLPYPAFS